jgi:Reverse transcriptase (RNA-dependent DNA polymerase).
MTSGFEKKNVFLDIIKTYNSKWHTGLFYKLVSMNVPGEYVRVIYSYLAQRFFRVTKDGAFSGWRPMLAGIPQGSLLLPLLYSLYTSDIAKYFVSELALYDDAICICDKTKKPKYANLSV